jgi:uncharacterized protein YbbC (DUF1343 family)
VVSPFTEKSLKKAQYCQGQKQLHGTTFRPGIEFSPVLKNYSCTYHTCYLVQGINLEDRAEFSSLSTGLNLTPGLKNAQCNQVLRK